ncbi:hypothetical protein DSCO28_16150 [Desulfosarcina ovata subsp. sediminis]|uniref:Uncharacterized protein n=1 Tax=Desulfosarcina ovata subsp. sediminis TaxID=885957 RepID=A0A5K7ZN74_9BACT|nr:hypothetical protein DSCO28_16150 [Desulfosarcina ovata subsp. sediminis]
MLLTEKYSDQIAGVLYCYNRIVIQGTISGDRLCPSHDQLFVFKKNSHLPITQNLFKAIGCAVKVVKIYRKII